MWNIYYSSIYFRKHIFSDIFNLPYVFDGYDYNTHRFDPVYQLNNFFMQIYDNFRYIFMSLTTFPMGLTVNELSSGKWFWLISPEICETFWGSTSEHLTWINLEQKLSSILMKLLIWNISAQVNYTLAKQNFWMLTIKCFFFKLDFASCIPVIHSHKTLAFYFPLIPSKYR